MTRQTGRHHGGFTLLEVLIVTFVIGIIMGIAIPSYLSSREGSHRDICRENRRTADRWLRIYVDKEQHTPEDIQELVDAGYLSLVHCPGGGTYELVVPEGTPEETETYHPVPYLRCTVHGADRETEDEEEEVEVLPDPPLGPVAPGP